MWGAAPHPSGGMIPPEPPQLGVNESAERRPTPVGRNDKCGAPPHTPSGGMIPPEPPQLGAPCRAHHPKKDPAEAGSLFLRVSRALNCL